MTALVRQMKKLCLHGRREDFETRDDEQQLQPQSTMEQLQQTMDPLIAAQVYNRTHSLILRLPQEVLLHIIHYLGGDIVDLYCIRRTSKQFRRLVYEPEILQYLPYQPILKCLMRPSVLALVHDLEVYYPLQRDFRQRLLQRLRRDNMCDKCKLWFEIPTEGRYSQYLQGMHLKKMQFLDLIGSCKFKMLPHELYRCGCKRYRKCIGHKGAVQLCEHVHISWYTIEIHIYKWRRRKPKDWQACFDDFLIECHDLSHDTRCTPEEAPTWPRARLQTAEYSQNLVVLNLEFAPHSGLDIFTPTADWQVHASELRTLFRKHRQGPADLLFPPYPAQYLPEMVCFDPSTCSCVYYEGDSLKKPLTAGPLQHASIFSDDRGCHVHSCSRRYGHGKNGNRVHIASHWPKGRDKSACLITTYQRDILICHVQQDIRIKPTRDWLHAMDPESYKSPVPGRLCKDKNCTNYCRKQYHNFCGK